LLSLPARFEEEKIAMKAIDSLWKRKFKNGFAAYRGDELIAYLIVEPTIQAWGRCGYIYLPGYGLVEGESPELLQDLYALVGEEWNRRGCFNQYIYISAADTAVIDAWFSLGFGRERVDVLLDLRTLEVPKVKPTGGFEIRQARKGDNARLAELSDTIARHQSSAPRWHPFPPVDLPDLAEGRAELADDPEWTIWLAIDGKETLGSLGFRPIPELDDDLTCPPRTTDLTIAAVKESARGRGILSALTWHGLDQARQAGYEYCLTNWQTANLHAARFWPRFGFEPAAYRLARKIDPAIAWASG
jgi:GNAT superfamily N-acetyltransferase